MKRNNVVLLSTNDKFTPIGKFKDTNKLVHNTGKDIPRGEMQHMYILEGDDVVCTTKKEMGLPSPPVEFIENFIKKWNETH